MNAKLVLSISLSDFINWSYKIRAGHPGRKLLFQNVVNFINHFFPAVFLLLTKNSFLSPLFILMTISRLKLNFKKKKIKKIKIKLKLKTRRKLICRVPLVHLSHRNVTTENSFDYVWFDSIGRFESKKNMSRTRNWSLKRFLIILWI